MIDTFSQLEFKEVLGTHIFICVLVHALKNGRETTKNRNIELSGEKVFSLFKP
jgi:hypothetical protein